MFSSDTEINEAQPVPSDHFTFRPDVYKCELQFCNYLLTWECEDSHAVSLGKIGFYFSCDLTSGWFSNIRGLRFYMEYGVLTNISMGT